MFNIISLIGFILMLCFGKLIVRYKYGNIILRALSIVLIIYKLGWYVLKNIKGQISIPVEISALSYFLVAFIVCFKMKKFYNIASFFGISAGLGFFFFYIFAGYTVQGNFSILSFVISNLCHGYLLFAGIYLFEKNNFKNSNKLSIWVTILGMLVWSLVFFEVEQGGITFIYYLIKPTYLFVFDKLSLNILIMILFYMVVILVFYLWTRLFYWLNNKKLSKALNFSV